MGSKELTRFSAFVPLQRRRAETPPPPAAESEVEKVSEQDSEPDKVPDHDDDVEEEIMLPEEFESVISEVESEIQESMNVVSDAETLLCLDVADSDHDQLEAETETPFC